ncbi:MAG TPA: tetratricopeptide repeat protein [Candidatus Acidoferrum sp.]|nr:tetratricopeptide repeat protein [Candidatus Acidoferrum sp.]
MLTKIFFRNWTAGLELGAMAIILCGCGGQNAAPAKAHAESSAPPARATAEEADRPDACQMALAPHAGQGRIDRDIARQQANVRNETHAFQSLENLGWLFVSKARESFDPGYYKLAEQCALCLESRQPRCPEALLLRGHVLQSLHQFKEAEPLAKELVARRGLAFDYGLLGDVVMEQGRLSEAAEAYQTMVDQKPDLQAYARISYLRWLKGDVAGAAQLMRMAASAASPNSPESAAWVNTRLALLQFQQGNLGEARQTCTVALDYQRDYAPALLVEGRLLLAEGRISEALEPLQRAVRLNPLPDCQWVLIEALRAAGRSEEAATVDEKLRQTGAAADPRTFALYLASRGGGAAPALDLARRELQTRADVFTHDALAWALAANGQLDGARAEMQRALAEGTKDSRLFFHAAVIFARAGQKNKARRWLDKVAPMRLLLLPSEQRQWQTTAANLGQPETTTTTVTLFTPAK